PDLAAGFGFRALLAVQDLEHELETRPQHREQRDADHGFGHGRIPPPKGVASHQWIPPTSFHSLRRRLSIASSASTARAVTSLCTSSAISSKLNLTRASAKSWKAESSSSCSPSVSDSGGPSSICSIRPRSRGSRS